MVSGTGAGGEWHRGGGAHKSLTPPIPVTYPFFLLPPLSQVLSGLFENLHSIKFLDINFKRTSDMADRIAEADIIMRCGWLNNYAWIHRDHPMPYFCTVRYTRQHNEYSLMQYIVPPMLFCHLTAAQAERPIVEWPKAQGEAGRRQAAAAELARGWGSTLSAEAAQGHSRASLMLVRILRVEGLFTERECISTYTKSPSSLHSLQEVLPALKVVLAPPIRAIAAHMLSAEEQGLMTNTVGVMLGYALGYDLHAAAAQEAMGMANRPGTIHYLLANGLLNCMDSQRSLVAPPYPSGLIGFFMHWITFFCCETTAFEASH